MKTLTDKVAIVTGGGQGVGLGIAQAFANEGASLVITGRTESRLKTAAELLSASGALVHTVVADTRSQADARKTVAAALSRFGQLDILVNNAQSSVPGQPLEDIDDDTFRLTLESGLYGTFYHMQAALPHLKSKGGSIINLGSREGIFGGAGFAAYAASKEGIRGLSRCAAREWGRYKIRVNVICPAALSPAAVTYLTAHPAQAEAYRSQVALGYFGDPLGDIGPVAVFLASPASGYLTGQTLNVDGGQVML